MKAFLLVFDTSQIAQSVITKKLDRLSAVRDWYAFLSNTICLLSNESAPSLSRLIRDAFPDVRFIIVQIDPAKKGGWLPKSVWEFIRKSHATESSAA